MHVALGNSGAPLHLELLSLAYVRDQQQHHDCGHSTGRCQTPSDVQEPPGAFGPSLPRWTPRMQEKGVRMREEPMLRYGSNRAWESIREVTRLAVPIDRVYSPNVERS